jgi:hypothetical protein
MVMPECLPPGAGVATTLCGPDGTFTLVPQLGQVNAYTVAPYQHLADGPLPSARVECRFAYDDGCS